MKNVVSLIIASAILIACSKVPITNRKQTNLLPESTLINMSEDQYAAFLAEAVVLPDSDPRAKKVKEVGEKIKAATESFLNSKGYQKRIEGFAWEFKTVKNDTTINAWCMPGGKVCVYTGILPLFESDDEMAVVMGHEIAHAIARHGNERMSQQMIINGVGSVLSPADTTQVSIFQKVFIGAGTLGMLKYSRDHESEADKLGLVFAKLAGYDPAAAITFWKKMAAQGGAGMPEIFSTHPSDERRIADLEEFLKEIDQYTE
ncbi:M48 family metallopeptidase [Parvicella tangerina]|uniref:Beta-barrel assembly-enhancing protease n=1 Tax=Parvicella tangerina TaxID=2829795 RepID=A0A916NU64_9FLAO|nr:M48 family metallopeptidase [Parvicella tangerina]CAG5087360.1 Beta-barrel assembly-enhancing protease [Parvicella tangerina]